MKTRNYLLGLLFIALAVNTVLSQNLQDIQRGQRGYVPPPLDREQGAMAIDNTLEYIDEEMDLYEQEFKLDAFEKAVLKNYIIEFETQKMGIQEREDISYDVKVQNILKLKETFRPKLLTLLNEDEIVRFQELHYATKSEKKKRRKNKG